MKNTIVRGLSLLLCLLLVATLAPISVFAASPVTKVDTEAELADALTTGGNIALDSDIVINETILIPAGVTVTLDLNGHAITVVESSGKHIYAFNNNGVMTLKDSVGTGSVTARGIYNGYDGSNTSNTVAGAKLTVLSGKYVAMDIDGGAAIFNCAELVVDSGTFEGGICALNNRVKGVATINGGTFRSGDYAGYGVPYAIQNNGGNLQIVYATVDKGFGAVGQWGGSTVIENGSFKPTGTKGTTCNVVYVGSGDMTILDGEFKMNYPADAVPDSGAAVVANNSNTLTINGGSFSGLNGAVSGNANSIISGGTFVNQWNTEGWDNISNYVVSGLKVDATTGEVVKDVDDTNVYVAFIGPKGYTTLKDAVAAVQEGQTIKLMAGTFEEGTIKLPATLKNVTIKGAAGQTSVLKDMTVTAADGNAINYEGITFDGIVFDNSNIVITGWRTGGEVCNNLTVTNCVFKNIVRTTNQAAVHLNLAGHAPVNGFVFTNNIIDGVSGASNSGIYTTALTGDVVINDNTINNVAFRPYIAQFTSDDGVADSLVVTGNTFSGSAKGRAQALSNNVSGTDKVELVVSGNIFEGITATYQICYWNFNAETTEMDLSGNYFDIDIEENPDLIYMNSACQNNTDLYNAGLTYYYEELNEDGTIDTSSKNLTGAASFGGDGYSTLQDAIDAALPGSTIVLEGDVMGAGVTINKSITIDFNGFTYEVTSPVSGGDGIVIKSGLNVTLKNGSITADSKDIYALIQNSANLTVEDMTIRGGNAKFALSNNICKVQILGDTNIYAQNIAFDAYAYCTVTVNTTGVIDGNIQVSGKNASLTVENGNFTVAPKAEWLAENAILTEKANGTYLVKKAVGIVGTNMTLGSDLNVNFYVNKADLKGIDYYAIITETAADGTVKTVKVPYAAWTAKGDLLKITFQGLAAKEMSDTLTIQIFDSNTDVAVSKLHKDSVRDYAMRVLAKAETTAKEKTLIVDMLNYGAAAQKFFNYNTENLANALLSDEQKGFATAEVTAEDKRVKGEKYVGSMLKLENSVQLVLVFEGLTEDMVAMVTYEGQSEPMILDSSKFVYNSNGQVAIVIDTLEPADASKVVTCMIVDGGEVISTVSDSIESYVARVNNGAGANELYDAILKFAASAAANK